MKKFEALTLEDAFLLAANDYGCSITDLEINIIQQPTSGFLGFGKKNAIIMVALKENNKKENSSKNMKYKTNSIDIKDIKDIEDKFFEKSEKKPAFKKEEKNKTLKKTNIEVEKKDEIFDNFYVYEKSKEKDMKISIKKDKEEMICEIHKVVNNLFGDGCFELDEIKVNFYDEDTVYIEFAGPDAALLIGKEGYRYKALSYILFNWINEKYGFMLRLEVAEFLRNQEENIYKYLEPIIENIKRNGTSKTKPLDGILSHIALKKLREEFPNKYVAIKQNQKGDKYVLVS